MTVKKCDIMRTFIILIKVQVRRLNIYCSGFLLADLSCRTRCTRKHRQRKLKSKINTIQCLRILNSIVFFIGKHDRSNKIRTIF